MRPRESITPGLFARLPLPHLSQSAILKSLAVHQGGPAPPCPNPRPAPAAHSPRPRCGDRRSCPAVLRRGIAQFVIIHVIGAWPPQETRAFPPFCAVIVAPSACCTAVIRVQRVNWAGVCCAAAASESAPSEARSATHYGALTVALGHFLRGLVTLPPGAASHGHRCLQAPLGALMWPSPGGSPVQSPGGSGARCLNHGPLSLFHARPPIPPTARGPAPLRPCYGSQGRCFNSVADGLNRPRVRVRPGSRCPVLPLVVVLPVQ